MNYFNENKKVLLFTVANALRSNLTISQNKRFHITVEGFTGTVLCRSLKTTDGTMMNDYNVKLTICQQQSYAPNKSDSIKLSLITVIDIVL